MPNDTLAQNKRIQKHTAHEKAFADSRSGLA